MKIKLALLEQDQGYLNRIAMVFSTKYADKLEIYSFTNREIAMEALESARIDVLVAGSTFEIDADALPRRCGFAYFVESADIEAYKGQRAICKFQKADLIYRQILSIYSEVAGSVSGLKMGDDLCKVIAFTSPCGGTGTSSIAAAYALRAAAEGRKTLYLNLEKFGSCHIKQDGAVHHDRYADRADRRNQDAESRICCKFCDTDRYHFDDDQYCHICRFVLCRKIGFGY